MNSSTCWSCLALIFLLLICVCSSQGESNFDQNYLNVMEKKQVTQLKSKLKLSQFGSAFITPSSSDDFSSSLNLINRTLSIFYENSSLLPFYYSNSQESDQLSEDDATKSLDDDDDDDLDARVRSLMIKIVLCIFYIFICVSCTLGNILVILSVFTYKPLQSVQNIFIVSLAVADTFVAVFVMPFHVIFHLTDGVWLFGSLICHFFIVSDILLCTASILHLCCIALDRYWAIKDSIKYAQQRTLKRVLSMIALVWISSAFISLPGIFWNSKIVGSYPDPAASTSVRAILNC